jgi:ABC-type transport system involved in Fe-S cluster assembly fused permease/ATPase subunit
VGWILSTGLKETGNGVKETKKWATTSNFSEQAEVCNYSCLCSWYNFNILFTFVNQRYPKDFYNKNNKSFCMLEKKSLSKTAFLNCLLGLFFATIQTFLDFL